MLKLALFALFAFALTSPASAKFHRYHRRQVNNCLATAYYAGWHSSKGAPVDAIPWNKYNTLIYAFAGTTSSVSTITLNGSDPDVLPGFVSQAHAHGVAAHISVGGWGGSRFFSSNVATAANRTAFAETIINFVKQYELDGVNIDWEYPSKQGIGCNVVSPNDTANFLAFLQVLREKAGTLTISAAVPLLPFNDANGQHLADVSGFAKVLDYIIIMNYDIWGPWSPAVGPNAPLSDTCAPTADQMGSAISGVHAWNVAGMPLCQIILGVPGYGHAYTVAPSDAFANASSTELAPYPPSNASRPPLGDSWDNTSGTDVCGVFQASGGTWNMRGLVQGGWLTPDGAPQTGILYRYDSCSHTSYIYNKTSQVMISFDDHRTFYAKGRYVKLTGLHGFSMWEEGSDYNNILLDAIRSGMSL